GLPASRWRPLLHSRRGRVRAAEARPCPGRVRLSRALPRADDRGRRPAVRSDRVLRASPGLVVAATPSDAELVARCRAGEQQAWNELVERFSRYVYAICIKAFRL